MNCMLEVHFGIHSIMSICYKEQTAFAVQHFILNILGMLSLTKKRHALVIFLEKCTIISLEFLEKIIKSLPFVYMEMIFHLYL